MPGFSYGGKGDGTDWSSERGNGPEPGGGHQGNSGNHDTGGSSKAGDIGTTVEVMKPGDSYDTPWGKVIISAAGQPVMNGTVMTYENSSLVPYSKGLYRVLNSLINEPVSSGGQNDAKKQLQTTVENRLLLQSGQLPPGYWLSNGKVMKKVREERTSGGGGKGNEHTRIVEVDREVPAFTAAYNEGIKMREEAAAAAAKRKQEEWDAAHPVEVAKRELDAANAELSSAQGEYEQADKRHTAAETQFRPLTSVDYAKEKTELAALENKMRQMGLEQADAVNNGDGLNPQGSGHGRFMFLLREMGKMKPVLAAKRASVASYESAKKELDESNRILGAATDKRAEKEGKVKNAESKLDNAIKEKAVQEENEIQDAIKFTADFYKELTDKFSDKASVLAQDFASKTRGKLINSVDDALAAFDRFKDVLDKKYSAADREAISNALMHRDHAQMASNLAKFSKAFGFVGTAIDIYDVFVVELSKAIKTNAWRPFFVKVESLVAGKVATGITAFAFSALAGGSLGILGFALIMALVGAFVDENLMEDINKLIDL